MFDSTIVVAIIGGACTVTTGIIAYVGSRKTNLSEAYRRLSEAQLNMQKEIDVQDAKISSLLSERDESREIMDSETQYIRELGHWLNRFCEIIDDEFLIKYPKPRLPDILRDKFGELN